MDLPPRRGGETSMSYPDLHTHRPVFQKSLSGFHVSPSSIRYLADEEMKVWDVDR